MYRTISEQPCSARVRSARSPQVSFNRKNRKTHWRDGRGLGSLAHSSTGRGRAIAGDSSSAAGSRTAALASPRAFRRYVRIRVKPRFRPSPSSCARSAIPSVRPEVRHGEEVFDRTARASEAAPSRPTTAPLQPLTCVRARRRLLPQPHFVICKKWKADSSSQYASRSAHIQVTAQPVYGTLR